MSLERVEGEHRLMIGDAEFLHPHTRDNVRLGRGRDRRFESRSWGEFVDAVTHAQTHSH